jgi:hypothetical protein
MLRAMTFGHAVMANLAGSSEIESAHIGEAIHYRRLGLKNLGLLTAPADKPKGYEKPLRNRLASSIHLCTPDPRQRDSRYRRLGLKNLGLLTAPADKPKGYEKPLRNRLASSIHLCTPDPRQRDSRLSASVTHSRCVCCAASSKDG